MVCDHVAWWHGSCCFFKNRMWDRVAKRPKSISGRVGLRRLQTLDSPVWQPSRRLTDLLPLYADPFSLRSPLPFDSSSSLSLFTNNPLGISLTATSFFFLCGYHTSFRFIHPSQTLFTFEIFPKYPHVGLFRNRINIDQVVKPCPFFFNHQGSIRNFSVHISYFEVIVNL